MVLPILIFLLVFAGVAFGMASAFGILGAQLRNQFRVQLRDPRVLGVTSGKSTISLRHDLGSGAMANMLRRSGIIGILHKLILQAGLAVSPEQILVFAAVLAVAFVLLSRLTTGFLPSVIGLPLFAAIGAFLPVLWVRRKRSQRLTEFEAQFPEALEFLSRSMRAGHGFLSGLQLLAKDSPEPLGSIFAEAANELKLGAPLESALAKLSEKAPLLDIRFFSSAVLLQQSAGGDLSEILMKLAWIIRERLRLKGQVRAASAHGRMTGMVLMALPILLLLMMLMLNPTYIVGFAVQKEGRIMLTCAAVGQLIGFAVIRRIVNIKV